MPDNLYLDKSTGKVMVGNDPERAQQRGWEPISKTDADALVAKRKERAEAESVTGQVRTGLEGFSTGAFDALTAAARVPTAAAMAVQEVGTGLVGGAAEKLGLIDQGSAQLVKAELARNNATLLAQTSGRQVLANTFGVIDEIAGNSTAEAGALRNAQQQRLDAEVNRGTAFVGSAAGQVLAAVPFAGLTAGTSAGLGKTLGGGFLARQGGRFLAGAVEGAPIAAIMSQDQAFLEDRQLTSQQMMADTGLGAFLAGSVAFAGGLAAEGAGAAKRSISAKLAARSTTASAEGAAALEAGAADLAAPEAAAAAATGTATTKGRAGIASLVRDLSVADDKAIINVAGNELGVAVSPELPKVLRQAVREGTGAAREEMVAEATGKLAAPMRDLLPAQEAIQDLVDTAPMKRAQVAAKFARDGIGDEATTAARTFAANMRQTVDDLAQDATAGRAAQNGAYRGLQTTLRKLESQVATAETPEAAYMAIDQMRRDTYGVVKSLNLGASRSADPSMLHAANALLPELNKSYLGAANFLMDESTWGSMGAAQKAVNTARVKLIQGTQDGLGTVVDRLQSKDLDLATGTLKARFDVNEGKISSLVKNFGTPNGAVAERRFAQYHSALRDFAEAVSSNFELEGEQATALAALRKGAGEIGKTFDEVSRVSAAHNQVASLFERAGHGNAAKIGGIVGGFVGGGPGAALGAGLGALSNPAELLIQRVKLEGAAQSGRARASALLDGFFAPIRKAANATGELVADQAPKMAARLEFQSPRAAFQGNHDTAQDAYLARVSEIQDAGRNFAQGARDGAHKSFGELVTSDPHVATAAVVTATNAINFLQSKIPVDPLFDPESMTPTASKLRPSPAQLGEFARYWHAVYEPMSVLRSLKNGTAGPQEIEALQVVYPSFYQWVRTETMTRLRKLDEQGITVPPYQRQLLDALLDLKGAGDRTLTADFALKHSGSMGDAGRPQNPPQRPAPSSKPIRTSLHTETDSMIGGAQ